MTKLGMFHNVSTLNEKRSEKIKKMHINLCIGNFLPACSPALQKQTILFSCSKSVTRDGNDTKIDILQYHI